MKQTSQRSLLFRHNVNWTEERVHFINGYRKALITAFSKSQPWLQ